MNDRTKQIAIRRRNFEVHVSECEDCQVKVDEDVVAGLSYDLCMSGTIMLTHYVRALKAPEAA